MLIERPVVVVEDLFKGSRLGVRNVILSTLPGLKFQAIEHAECLLFA